MTDKLVLQYISRQPVFSETALHGKMNNVQVFNKTYKFVSHSKHVRLCANFQLQAMHMPNRKSNRIGNIR